MAHFAVTAIGADRPGIVAGLTEALQALGGNLEDVSSTILRGHFAMMLVADVPHPGARVRSALEDAAGPLGVRVHVADVEAGAPERPRPTHVLTAYGSDRPGIVAGLARLLAARGVNITDLSCRRTQSDDPIYAMVAELAVPSEADPGELEAAVRELAERTGLDARFVPAEVADL